ncbi:MAG: alpha/beta hydrolase [Candidatus Undinarchaeales archaeon]|jgi:hypothetical protein|nr:alpha/beta hydrolase [Candidatus Undinarchaeales archaeon]MDP7493940.1 alpha/beta hydrolase [Candidatus Undinarchaeales archaeon]
MGGYELEDELSVPEGYTVEQVTVPGDGAELIGEVWTPDDPNGAGVVLCHGYKGSRANHYDLAQMLYDEGFTVLLYDERAHAASEADFDLRGMMDDSSTAVEWLRDRVDGDKVGLFGHSMGGYVTASSAALYGNMDCLVTWGAPISMRTATKDHADGRLPRFLYFSQLYRILHIPFTRDFLHVDDLGALVADVMDPDQPNLTELAAKIDVPYTIIHGTEDDEVLPYNAEGIHKAAGGSTELAWVPGGHHNLDPLHPYADDDGTRVVAMETAVERFKRYLLDA